MGCRQTCQEEREGWWTLNAANKQYVSNGHDSCTLCGILMCPTNHEGALNSPVYHPKASLMNAAGHLTQINL